MSDLVLFHAAPSRSSIIRWMLEEIGAPYDLRLLDLQAGDNRKPDFLALNPMGKVPVLKHGDVVVSEAAAIATYLAEAFPAANLGVPVGDPRRGAYLKWLFFGPSCLEPSILERNFPRKDPVPRSAAGFADADTVFEVLAKAAGAAKPYLLGAQFTAADIIVGSGLRWGLMFKLLPERAEFGPYISALNARPALQRATALDDALARKPAAS